jgi:subfamily B ATP-binding cassette protein MsbA
MNAFFKQSWPYIRPYLPEVLTNVITNLLSVIFSLFSLAMLIPVLSILFGQEGLVAEPVPLSFNTESLRQNFYYFLSSFVSERPAFEALTLISVMIVVMFFFKNLFLYVAKYFAVTIRSKIARDIRNRVYRKILKLPLGYFTEERKGDLIVRFTTDVTEIETAIIGSMNVIFKDGLNVLVFMISLVIISPELTIFVLVLLPVSGTIIALVGKSLRKKSLTAQGLMGDVISHLEESLGGLRIIKAFTAEKTMGHRFISSNNHFLGGIRKVLNRQELASPLSEFMGAMVIAITIYYGGYLVLGESTSLQPSVFIAYMAIFSQMIEPAKGISGGLYAMNKGLAAFDRVNYVLESELKIDNIPNAKKKQTFDSSIEYRHVSFRYAKKKVLKDVSLTVSKGQTVALVGPSGSGKSTLIDLLLRFYDVEDGEISIDGENIKNYDLGNLRQLIGYVSQEPILFNDTIYNNIALAVPDATEDQILEAAKVANAHEFIMATENGYQTNIGDRGSKLSGGQRQRLSIARAVLANPPILLLDEATSALDTESEKLVQEALDHLMKNRTSIVIAHRLSTVKNADVIMVLQDGILEESGRHEDLINKGGVYNKLHSLQLV